MYTFSIVLVLLVAAVGDVLGTCTGTTKILSKGELKITGKKGSCENSEPIIGVMTECAGSCKSSSKISFTGGKRPKPEGSCECCKLQRETEETEVKLACTKTDGTKVNITKKIKFPKSCGCGECKRGGKKGGKGGKKGKPGKN